jgi:hypothetical protein
MKERGDIPFCCTLARLDVFVRCPAMLGFVDRPHTCGVVF